MIRAFASALLGASVLGGSADYKQNGADWHDLCHNGKEQSPIDLTVKQAVKSSKMSVTGYNYYDFIVNKSTYSASDPTMTTYFDNNLLRMNAELELTFADGSQSYFMPLQFHFHAPSEHSVNGKLYDAEVHLVHTIKGSQSVGSSLQPEIPGAVIGIFFDVKEGGDHPNAFLDSLFAAVASKDGTKPSTIDMRKFLASVDMTEYWSYDGSFTTPPCTEGLKWTVIKQVQSISPAQLERFTKLMAGNAAFANGKGNNRVVMPLNHRTLYYAASSATTVFAGFAAAAAALLAF